MDNTSPISLEERLHRWFATAENQPPEWLADYHQSPTAPWVAVVEDGPEIDRQRFTARLDEADDLACWALVLAKAYLDDVEEWPLFGIKAELALDSYQDHGDPVRAVQEIMAAIQPVWPEVKVVQVHQEKNNQARLPS